MFVSVIPVPDVRVRGVGPLDKPFHLCEYLLLAWLIMQVGASSAWSRTRQLATALLIPIAYGGAIEGIQSLIPYRSAEWGDFIANAIGAGLGVAIGLVLHALGITIGRSRDE